ncbi:MAG: glycosyltransferase family 2 protein, partial [Candidatus Marinimicrobia bacterium]|nr:glycosyltransferase family 2 protein [Candidatus Neomarinimicrobiota bacterium]
YDYWLRTSLKYHVGLVNKFGIKKYGGHSDQLSQKYWGMDRFRIQSLEKILTNESLDKEKKHLLLNTLLKKLNIMLIGAKKRDKNVSALVEKIKKYENMNFEF